MSCLLNDDAVSPATSRKLHAVGARQGISVMDIAFSGSTPAVEQGTIVLQLR